MIIDRFPPLAMLCLGIAAAVTFAGCSEHAAKHDAGKSAEHGGDHAGHDHPHDGPHGGQLIELGGNDYHAELLHDDATHKVTLYILDGKAKDAVPIEATSLTLNLVAGGAPEQFELAAVPTEQDPAGQSSRFELISEPLIEGLDKKDAKGRINLTIAGKPYSGEIAHHGHDHDHGAK